MPSSLSTTPGLNTTEQNLLAQSQGKSTQAAQPSQGTPGSLDPDAVNLAKAIRQTESGGNFTAKGKSGEYGAYQYTAPTWAKDSTTAGVNVPLEQATPEEQNQVAYTKIKALKDQGYNVGQIASIWNSGNPNAYMSNDVGVNKYGASYNVPAYAKSVATAYQQLKNNPNANIPADPNNPSSTANTTPVQQPPESLGDRLGSAAAGITNFIAPVLPDIVHDIKGDSTKTGLEQLGDLGSTGLSALALVPGLEPEALAGKLGLAGEGGLGLAGRIAANSALGAGFGATNAIGQGDTNIGQIAKSAGTGGLLGGGLGLAGEAVGGALGKIGSKTPASRLSEQAGGTKALQNALRDNTKAATETSGATDPITTFEQRGYTPQLKVQDSKVNVDAITNPSGTGSLDTDLENESANASELVKSMKGGVPTQQFKNDVLQEVTKNPDIVNAGNVSKAQAEVERKFTDLQNSYGDVLPWKAVDGIRSTANKDYEIGTRDVSRSIGDTARKYLYDGGEVPSGLLPSVSLNQGGSNSALRAAMQNEGELIRARNFAEKLRGSTVKGGKIGKYFWDTIGAGIGTAVGSGGGPIGAGLGGLVGGFAADKGRKYLEEGYFNPTLGKTASRLLNNGATRTAAKAANYGLLRSAK